MVRGLYFQVPSKFLRSMARIRVCGASASCVRPVLDNEPIPLRLLHGTVTNFRYRCSSISRSTAIARSAYWIWFYHAPARQNKMASPFVGIHRAQGHDNVGPSGIFNQMLREQHFVSPTNHVHTARACYHIWNAHRDLTALTTYRHEVFHHKSYRPGISMMQRASHSPAHAELSYNDCKAIYRTVTEQVNAQSNDSIAYIRQPLPRPVGFDPVGVQITTAIAIDPRDHDSCGISTNLSLLT